MSQALHHLGVSFGDPSQLFPADEFNRDGYWEHRAVTTLHRKFRLSLNLAALETDPAPDDWNERPATPSLVDSGARILQEHLFGRADTWAWKDPDASASLAFVSRYFAEAGAGTPHVVVAVRNPLAVARSEARRKGVPPSETIGSWLAHTLLALEGSREMSRSILVFEHLLENSRASLSTTVEACGLRPTESQWRLATESVKSERVTGGEDQPKAGLPELVRRVWEGVKEGRVDTEAPSWIEEWKAWRSMFTRPSLDESTAFATWERSGQTVQSSSTYRPTRGFQRVSVEVGALPATLVRLHLYPLPATLWIRSAEWEGHGPTRVMAGKSGNLRKSFEMDCVTVLHGPDQITVRTPNGKGPFQLNLDILVESNNLITGDTFAHLSDAVRG